MIFFFLMPCRECRRPGKHSGGFFATPCLQN